MLILMINLLFKKHFNIKRELVNQFQEENAVKSEKYNELQEKFEKSKFSYQEKIKNFEKIKLEEFQSLIYFINKILIYI